jgi:hypothetical protein
VDHVAAFEADVDRRATGSSTTGSLVSVLPDTKKPSFK